MSKLSNMVTDYLKQDVSNSNMTTPSLTERTVMSDQELRLPVTEESRNKSANISVPIIGIHKSPLVEKFGTPRQPNLVNMATHIDILAPYNNPDAFIGIEEFSHLWITWQFHQNRPQTGENSFRAKVRPPRLGGNNKVGVFASRSMYRPSELGLSVVQLDRVEVVDKNLKLYIIGADFIDGTPIIDIKPYIAYSDAIVYAECGYAQQEPETQSVSLSTQAEQDFTKYKASKKKASSSSLSTEDLANILALIAQDPRPAYKRGDETPYFMRYKDFDVKFIQMTAGKLMVLGFNKI